MTHLRRRRLRASAIDLAVVAGWLGVLASGAAVLPGRRYRDGLFRSPRTADLAQFATGVLPVAVYLSSAEGGAARATAGKRAAHLVVVAADGRRASRRRVAVRTAVKLLPWQIAHLAVTRAVGAVPGRHAQQAAKAGFGAALGLAALSAACAAGRADGRALHDLVAGTRVVPDDGDDTDGGRR